MRRGALESGTDESEQSAFQEVFLGRAEELVPTLFGGS